MEMARVNVQILAASFFPLNLLSLVCRLLIQVLHIGFVGVSSLQVLDRIVQKHCRDVG